MNSTRQLLLNALSFAGRKLRRTPLVHSILLNRVQAALSLWLHSLNEVKIGPFRVRFDPRDRLIAKKLTLYSEYEKHEIALLCSLVKLGDHVLDIGANIGLYSLYLSRAVGLEGRVVAVEPDADNLALLRDNLESNGYKNVTVLPCAFGVESGYVELFQDMENRGQLSFADVSGTGSKAVVVPVRRGEEALAELGLSPVAAKIDVVGAEPLVLSGLGRYKPNILLFEFIPKHLRALGHDPKVFLDSLAVEGYVLELIDTDTGTRTRSTPSAITALADQRNTIYYNVLAMR